MEHLLPQPPHTSYYDPWSPYHDHVLDYAAGDLHTAAHHASEESYQNLQYAHFNHQSYAIAPHGGSSHQSPLVIPDASMLYWQTAQLPTTACGPPLSTGLPEESMYYTQTTSCYSDGQSLSSTEHRHAAADGNFHQPALTSAGATYGPSSLTYTATDRTLIAPESSPTLPALAPYLPIAQDQGENGHNHVPQDATGHPALYEVSAHQRPADDGARSSSKASRQGNSTFRSADPSNYAQARLYDKHAFAAAGSASRHYAAVSIKEEDHQQQQAAYMPPSAPAPDAHGPYVAAPAPVPVPSPPKVKSESPARLPRARSPMGHLPYPEDLANANASARADDRRGHSSVFSAAGGDPSPSPASTPAPLSPVLQTLTFIRYPETEPRYHRDGRGAGGAESDEFGDDEDGVFSPSRRGRRGRKEPKKDPFLACFFCRGRKIACHPKNEGGEDRTCT
ncbi:hypothetical protein F5148DRAFT_199532 [Russula earlei]|uniref:Uncharacterized protein n=1 Tax=Russula earlei TaxID=71964 RepID=A0ACC0U6H9_9AGAM|nr:hypothetical protein F5148DRAFT_199532 [Russula earlei]